MRAAPPMYEPLEQLRVRDVMHPGLISCSLDSSLPTAARMMATYRVHAILVADHEAGDGAAGGFWGVISDRDLLRAAEAGEIDEQTVRTVAATPALTVAADEELARAAQMMVEHDLSHLVVVDPESERPVGVLSTLDVARALAGPADPA